MTTRKSCSHFVGGDRENAKCRLLQRIQTARDLAGYRIVGGRSQGRCAPPKITLPRLRCLDPSDDEERK